MKAVFAALILLVGVAATAQDGYSETTRTSVVSGSLNLAFVFFTMPGGTLTATAADVTKSVTTGWFGAGQTSVSTIFSSNSYGALTVGSVQSFGPLALSLPVPTVCNGTFYDQLDAAFVSALATAGINPASYDYVVFVVPSQVGALCGWLGTTWAENEATLSDEVNPILVAHEIGHLFGLGHAAYDANNDGVIHPADGDAEYGDPSCIMGGAGKYYNLAHPEKQAWWIAAGGNLAVAAASGAGDYTLRPFQETPTAAGGATQAVRIDLTDGSNYLVTFAKNTGAADPSYELGIYSNNRVYVTRTYPSSTKTYLVGVLGAGQSFVDETNLVTVQTSSISTTAATVRISRGILDSDSDGTIDSADTDDDNDGVADAQDCAPLSASQWRNVAYVDADEDGISESATSGTIPYCYGTTAPAGYVATSTVIDNCPTVANSDQADTNHDGTGDACSGSGGTAPARSLKIDSGTNVKTTKKSYNVLGTAKGIIGATYVACKLKKAGATKFAAAKLATQLSSLGSTIAWKFPVATKTKGRYQLQIYACDSRGCISPKTVTITRR